MSGSEKFTICISKTPVSYPVHNTQLYENKKMILLLLAVFLFNLVILLSIYNFYNGHMINYENSSSADLVRIIDFKVTIKASSDSDHGSFHSITAVSDTFQTEDNVKEHGDNRKEEAEESDSSLQTGDVDGAMITANSSVSSEYASNESSHEASSEFELPKLNECGRRMIENKNFTEDLEVNTYFGQYPWILALLYYNSRGAEIYKCGASLIAPDIALTAAHCVQFDVEYLVRSGEWYIGGNRDEEYLPIEKRGVTNVVLHPLYNAETLENDIALLKLTSSIDYVDHIQPICLMDWFVQIDANSCILTGWGKDGPADLTNNKFLRRIGLTLLDRELCEKELHQTKLSQYFTLPYGNMCAWNTSSPINSCKGDGGSPLICPTLANPHQYVQVGIAIWSVDCNPAVPDIYTNVEAHRDWIDEVVSELGNNNTKLTERK